MPNATRIVVPLGLLLAPGPATKIFMSMVSHQQAEIVRRMQPLLDQSRELGSQPIRPVGHHKRHPTPRGSGRPSTS
jgi:hypothetical protein